MTLRLVVCVKARACGASWEEMQASPHRDLTPASRTALAGALQLKMTHDAQVVALSLGGEETLPALRACLAAGADRVLHLLSAEGSAPDSWATARTLLPYLQTEEPSITLCGEDPTGANPPDVPVFLAELLGIPLVSGVVHLEPQADGRTAHLKRRTGNGRREMLSCPFPFIAVLSNTAYPLRYVSAYQRLRTDCGFLDTRPADVAENRTEEFEIAPARMRPRRIAAPQTAMSAADRMKFLLSGGKSAAPKPVSGTARIFEGSPDEAAERLYAFLKERGLLPGVARESDGGD